MRKLLYLIPMFIYACSSQVKTDNQTNSALSTDSISAEIIEINKTEIKIVSLDPNVGVEFFQSYIDNCNKMKESIGVLEWSESSDLATNNFKNTLSGLIAEAYEKDSIMGLGFDPIFDGQDYPDNVKILDFDNETGFLTLQGVNWDSYKVTIKLISEEEKTLVDGCGIINIPKDKRAERE